MRHLVIFIWILCVQDKHAQQLMYIHLLRLQKPIDCLNNLLRLVYQVLVLIPKYAILLLILLQALVSIRLHCLYHHQPQIKWYRLLMLLLVHKPHLFTVKIPQSTSVNLLHPSIYIKFQLWDSVLFTRIKVQTIVLYQHKYQ